MRAFDGVGPSVGPQRSPLGLSADPGGFPLYKSGTVVGGVGVIADGLYAHRHGHRGSRRRCRRGDRATRRRSASPRRSIVAAIASPPTARRCASATSTSIGSAQQSRVGAGFRHARRGRSARWSPCRATSTASIRRARLSVRPRRASVPTATSTFPGTRRVRVRRCGECVALSAARRHGRRALGGAVLTQSEVRTVLQSALDVANRARAQIRRPLGSQARVTISVVDTHGEILGMVAHARCTGVRRRRVAAEGAHRRVPVIEHRGRVPRGAAGREVPDDDRYVCRRHAIDRHRRLRDGAAHVPRRRQRARGRTHRLHGSRDRQSRRGRSIPDGIDDRRCRTVQQAGGRVEPVLDRLAARRRHQRDPAARAVRRRRRCSPMSRRAAPVCDIADDLSSVGQTITGVRLGNGLQIFPGSVPIYRGGTLVGAHRCVRRRRRPGRHDRVPRPAQRRSGARRRDRQRAGRSSRRHADRRRACGCATCNARKRRSSTALKTTCAGEVTCDTTTPRHSCALALAALLHDGRPLPPKRATRTTRAASSSVVGPATPKCRVPTRRRAAGRDAVGRAPDAQPQRRHRACAAASRDRARAAGVRFADSAPGSCRLRRLRAGARSLAHRRHARLRGALVRSRTTATCSRPTGRCTATTGSSISASSPTPSTSCARCRRRSAACSTERPDGIDVFGGADQWALVAEPRGGVRLLQGRHGLQAAGLRVPLHAGVQLQLRRARRRCRA